MNFELYDYWEDEFSKLKSKIHSKDNYIEFLESRIFDLETRLDLYKTIVENKGGK